jgi:hypothetical protein
MDSPGVNGRFTDSDENAFCGARLQECRVDSRVDVLPAVQREIMVTSDVAAQSSVADGPTK